MSFNSQKQIINTPTKISVSSNAGTVTRAYRNNNFTNSSAAATGSNNVVVTFNTAPFNPVSCYAFSYTNCDGSNSVKFKATATSPSTDSITVSSGSQIVGTALGGSNAGKNITINSSSRTLEYTNNIYNYIYTAFSANGLSAGSISTSVANSSDVTSYFLEITGAAATNTQGLLMMMI